MDQNILGLAMQNIGEQTEHNSVHLNGHKLEFYPESQRVKSLSFYRVI